MGRADYLLKSLKSGVNPIIVKEFRSRMRGWRAFAILTGYLVFLALFSYAIYRVILLSTQYGGIGMPLSPLIGQALYGAIANLSLFFVAFLTPALTAGAISSEHEHLTLEMLQATPLSAHTILLGKLISTAGYVLLLLFAAIPVASLVFMFGGISPADLLQAALIILVTGVTFGMIGLFFSAWRKRTMQAIVLSYLVIMALSGGTYVIYAFWGILIQDIPPRYVLVLNPFSALASIFATISTSQAGALFGIFNILAGLNPGMSSLDPAMAVRPLWHYTLAFYVLLSLGLYLLATRFIQPIRAWRLSWRHLAVVALLIVLYGSISGVIFKRDIVNFISPPPETPTPSPVPAMFPAPVLRQDAAEPLPTDTPAATQEADN